MPIESYTNAEDVKPDSMVYNSYRGTIEEARLEIEQKKQEIEYLKKEHQKYAQHSVNVYRKAEERLRGKEEDVIKTWTHVEALQSNLLEWLNQRHMSNAVSNQGLTGMEHIVSEDGINPNATSDTYTNRELIPVNPPHYSK